MKILLYSDTHVGLARQAHTTPASAARLKELLWKTPYDILQANNLVPAICLGDLFDSYSNEEADIDQGLKLSRETSIILAGNHDVANRADKLSSLQLLNTVTHDTGGCSFLYNEYGEHKIFPRLIGSTRFTFIPHVATAELFEKALCLAETAVKLDPAPIKVLCLHCNYNLSEERVKTVTTLNLSQERAYELLGSFHRILIGHEHATRQDPNTDRIRLLGSIFPTGLGDLSDKWYWIYDTETGDLENHLSWSLSQSYTGKASALPDGCQFQFYDLDDDLPPGAGARLVTKLFANESTLVVRLRGREQSSANKLSAPAEAFGSLPDLIEQDLAKLDQNLLNLFREYRHAAED